MGSVETDVYPLQMAEQVALSPLLGFSAGRCLAVYSERHLQ